MSIEIRLFGDTAQAAHALADTVARAVQARLQHAPRALLLVSGGRSPLPMLDVLAQAPLPWPQIDVSLVDERCVPEAHADSNSALVRRHLLVDRAAAARWVPLLTDATVPDQWTMARQAAQAACQNAALADPAVVILGLGNDGHTASLFPDAPQWPDARQTSARYVAVQPQTAAHARVGLSLQALIDQKDCQVWSVGNDKLDTIKRLVELFRQVEHGDADLEQLHAAGPLALLIAHQKVTLHVFHSAS
ncbi:6-phosphogluconolactonase [Actimicrobium sp. GrIS 1.19]|uniref:6-phosphogluconolactonase n=1 Tax=Actimicrobium sp. GrIS 1.19 TaxID=3071708 RepID=UPI002DFC8406|nr:6-phosphogluconolactonase [Actimicrobium sp. GrIS 1.19]